MKKKRLCDVVAGLLLSAGSMLLVGCSTPQKTDFSGFKHHKIHDGKTDCAILVSAPEHWYDYLRVPFEPLYENVVASALKSEVHAKGYVVTFSATWQDLQCALKDPCVQTIVVAGHGKWYHWQASDDTVSDWMIFKFMNDNKIPKKKGLFIRHTCGDNKYGLPTKHLLNNQEYATLLYSLSLHGAKNIVIDDEWTEDDANAPKERERVFYDFGALHDTDILTKITRDWNLLVNTKGLYREKNALGASAVDNISNSRGYAGIIFPLEYLLNPIPAPEK